MRAPLFELEQQRIAEGRGKRGKLARPSSRQSYFSNARTILGTVWSGSG
jgi:hypothetical protein